MRIRQAKKIMKQVYKTIYWAYRLGYYCGKKDSGKIAGDHRLIAAICLTKKWEKRKLQNRLKKILKLNPFKPKELAHSVLQLKRYGVVSDSEIGEGCAFESVIEE